MTTDDNQTKSAGPIPPEMARLASQALDLWQNHLTALASDPKAKEEMARLVAPMTQMCASWMDMMQQGLRDLNAYPEAKTHAEQPASPNAAAERADIAEDFAGDSSCADSTDSAGPSPIEPDASPVAADVDADGAADTNADTNAEPAAGLSGEFVAAAADPGPAAVAGREPERESAPASDAKPASESGRAAFTDGGRDLARLADRLALLERELEGMRGRNRKRGEGTESAPDRADVEDVPELARAGMATDLS